MFVKANNFFFISLILQFFVSTSAIQKLKFVNFEDSYVSNMRKILQIESDTAFDQFLSLNVKNCCQLQT